MRHDEGSLRRTRKLISANSSGFRCARPSANIGRSRAGDGAGRHAELRQRAERPTAPSLERYNRVRTAAIAQRRISDREQETKLADGELTGELFETVAEPHLIQPTFIYDFPTDISPLSKCRADDPSIAERFELFVAGMELGNGFSELNDPERPGAPISRRKWRKAATKRRKKWTWTISARWPRPAADGRRGHRHRPAGDAAHRFALDSRSHSVSAAAAETAELRRRNPDCFERTGRCGSERAPAEDQMKFAWLVALRYLRSPNRPAVLRLVTLLAVVGVAAGVATLVIALAMNTGFRQAIRDRLLGVTAHVNLKPSDPRASAITAH